MRHSLAASLTLAVAVLGLAGPVAAEEQVPFRGRLEGDVTVTPLEPPYVQVDVDATGNATHLGRFALAIPHIVNRANMTATTIARTEPITNPPSASLNVNQPALISTFR